LRDDADVQAIRQQRAQAQAEQAQIAQAQVAAETAAKLGAIDTSKPSAFTDVTRSLTGYT
jgi:hypothetical protein